MISRLAFLTLCCSLAAGAAWADISLRPPVAPPTSAAIAVDTNNPLAGGAANPVTGGNIPLAGSAGPLEVTAAQSLEYHQEQHMYIARGAAKAVRGDMSIMADELQAYERIKPDGKKDIYQFIAKGHVRITSKAQHIEGDAAVYDLDTRMAKLTGSNLRFTSDTLVVTARDALEYWPDKLQAIARGQAVAVRDGRRVAADRLIAQFRTTAKGGQELEQVVAEDHVVITSATDVARGERAVYAVTQNKARLTGNVQITRGASQLAGAAAEVDFKTGISRMVADTAASRVQALFVPDATNQGAAAIALPVSGGASR
jgi:lipopolysaccharide export system protein LptA